MQVVGYQATTDAAYYLQVSGISTSFNSFDGVKFTGRVTNQTNTARRFVKVYAILVAANSQFIGTDDTYLSSTTLAPGATETFEVTVDAWNYQPCLLYTSPSPRD